MGCGSKGVVPAKAGTHSSASKTLDKWAPAFAGATRLAIA